MRSMVGSRRPTSFAEVHMPTRLQASRLCWLFLCSIALSGMALGQDPPPKITVRLWVVEVETDKLRNLGFDWSQITSNGEIKTTPVVAAGDIAIAGNWKTDARGFRGFLEALEHNSLARTLSEPTIVTLSGRKATLEIGQQTKFEATPTAIENQRVELEYRIELGQARELAGSTPLVIGSTVQVEAGQPCLISRTRGNSRSDNGKSRQTETLLLVQADRLP